MATYIGHVTITIGVSVQATSQHEAEVIAVERVFGRTTDNLDSNPVVRQRSYDKTAELRLLET